MEFESLRDSIGILVLLPGKVDSQIRGMSESHRR